MTRKRDKLEKTGKALYGSFMMNVGRAKNAYRLATRQVKAPDVGTTPHSTVMQLGRMQLLRYVPTAPPVHKVPVLFVPSLVNRHYILDLIPERSVVSYLLKKGYTVYTIDWGTPGPEDARTTLDDYVVVQLDLAIRRVMEAERVPPSLIGYCMGGTLSLIYAALFPANVRNLVLLATPVQFKEGGLLTLWAKKEFFNVNAFVDAHGLIPPSILNWGFTMLKPAWQVRNLKDLAIWGWNDDFLRGYLAISKWVNDSVPVAGEAFRQFVRDLYQEDRLANDTLTMAGQAVSLSALQVPSLNVIAEKDHIIPPHASLPLASLVKREETVTDFQVPVGHIGLTVGQGSFSKVWRGINAWLSPRSLPVVEGSS